jgi:hypothetical protein
MGSHRVVVVSDLHYAGDAEKARRGYESRAIANPVLRTLARAYRHFFWLRDPLAHHHLLDRFLAEAGDPDLAVALGDYSCDSAFVGVSDPAAFSSARDCLERLRGRFADRLRPVMGDHELGKKSLFGGLGGLRLASWHSAVRELAIPPCWTVELGRHTLLGIASSLVALPIYEPEALPEERAAWRDLRAHHLRAISEVFGALAFGQRVILFCHDPTALPFLAREALSASQLAQIELTLIGHLHSPLLLWESRLLCGMPVIGFLGNTVRRLSLALREAQAWNPFRVRLCPSLTGIQLLKDGGFVTLDLDDDHAIPPAFRVHRLPWNNSGPVSGAGSGGSAGCQ